MQLGNILILFNGKSYPLDLSLYSILQFVCHELQTIIKIRTEIFQSPPFKRISYKRPLDLAPCRFTVTLRRQDFESGHVVLKPSSIFQDLVI
ncbi:hypothetical protein QQP08_026995 [Theobroma cacao]|nr:hypothetical protein QQP08_026995 [Theobroma cacao]